MTFSREGAQTTARAEPAPAFTVEQIATFFDLRERLALHVERAADAWFDRWRAANPQVDGCASRWFCAGRVEEFDEDEVTYGYYEDDNASYNRENRYHVTIPMADLLPEWGRARAALRALGAH